ncbi:MAG: hypothetical protein LQ340_007719 [Diploschistes diacapsis]|nr:MAG: hypothetical protein LQ340_007719 [Diploschistes diacapsis]
MSRHLRVIILTGAPSARSLSWTEAQLCAPLQEVFDGPDGKLSSLKVTDQTHDLAAWRVLPLEKRRISTSPTLDVQASIVGTMGPRFRAADHDSPRFLDLQSLSSQDGGLDDKFTQFLEQSFALHEHGSSLSRFSISEGSQEASVATTESFTTTSQTSSQPSMLPPIIDPSVGHITPLERIPSAAHIVSIRPQKMMRSLIVSILSISPLRPCRNTWGRYSQPADRLELIVADETRSGFGVNLWLPPIEERLSSSKDLQGKQRTLSSPWSSKLRETACSLMLRDIVLLRDVALTEFRGKVYANSREGSTRIELLFRASQGLGNRRVRSGRYGVSHLKRAQYGGHEEPVLAKTNRSPFAKQAQLFEKGAEATELAMEERTYTKEEDWIYPLIHNDIVE